MKHIVTLILILFTCHLFGQDSSPRIEKIVVEDKLFHGKIDKYPITIYLKFNQFSNYHAGVYSVQGWYYYDKIKTKISLTGLYDYPELTLYNFQDTTKRNELLQFSEMKSNHWEDMKYYKNLSGYQEKFVLTDTENYWTDNNRKLNINLNDNDLSIREVKEYLILDSTTAFDLHNFGGWTWNFEIVAHRESKFILQYEHGSRLYVMGRCGAGIEKGFLKLDFDENNKLILYEEFVYESCNYSISKEEKEEVSDNVTIYHCYDYINEKTYDLTVDLNELTIRKKETKSNKG